jgi:formate dehydrogenase major subunit
MVSLHPRDVVKLGLLPGEPVRLVTRRGEVVAHTRPDESTPAGAVFIPFCYVEAAANLLTNPKLDPFGKIPEFKYCGVRVERANTPVTAPTYGVAADIVGD